MFDHDADRMRGAGLTAFNPLVEPKALPEPRPLSPFDMLMMERLEAMLREERVKNALWPPIFLPGRLEPVQDIKDVVRGPTGATGCLSSPEYPKGMNGPTGITGGLPDREEGGFLPLLRGEWIPI